MSNPSAPNHSRSGGLSLYANLLDPTPSNTTAGASISRGPVVFKQSLADNTQVDDASGKRQQINPAALRFQPTKRPQLPGQKAKPKSTFPKPNTTFSSELTNAVVPSNAAGLQIKSTLADWTASNDDDDVNGFYGGGEKRQRGGRKKRKKNREEYAVAQDWDDIYDPSRPNSYDEYKRSDEKIREVREWKDRLYAHRFARKHSSDRDSEDEESKGPQMSNQFAPPPNYSFAPPPMDATNQGHIQIANISDYQTGDEAFTRRLRLSQAGQTFSPPPPTESMYSPPPAVSPPPPPPPSTSPPPPIQASAPGIISRAPVRYILPDPPSEIPASEADLEKALAEESEDQGQEVQEIGDAPRSLRPGQKGFAERLMSKYGWSKGSGLGADGSGIVNPLRVQIEKRKKKPDSEGGGFADPKGIGKIIGGKRKDNGKAADGGRFGVMSEVIVLFGMVDGMNLDEEFEDSGDGGLMQEIGDECSEKYGRVERVYIHRNGNASAKVFVKFTSQLSALRAVNALEGRIFNGNTISATFYDDERFEEGNFD